MCDMTELLVLQLQISNYTIHSDEFKLLQENTITSVV